MAPSTLSLFLAVLVFAGAKAADKQLGEACTSGDDTCVHTTLTPVCDDVTKTCRIKVAAACDGDGHGDLCVSGATCASDVCACQGPSYTVNAGTGKCDAAEGKPYGDCKSADPKCDDANAACDATSTKCLCNTGYKVKFADGTCESGAITVMASALTVMLVSVSCHLIMLH